MATSDATRLGGRPDPYDAVVAARSPLAVHVLWRSEDDERRSLATALYHHLARDPRRPLARGLGIPVRLWRDPSPEAVRAIALDAAARSALVPIVGAGMVLDGGNVLEALAQRADEARGRHVLLPVALREGALGGALGTLHSIRAFAWPEDERVARTLDEVAHDLFRLLTRTPSGEVAPPLRLFLSYARADGEAMADAVSAYVTARTAMWRFFGPNSVAHGEDYTAEIRREVEHGALVAFQTDSYASREWCRREVLIAKAAGRPVVVVNAVRRGEERSFPYLGNVPTLRWEPHDDPAERAARVCALLVREALRVEHFAAEVRERGLARGDTHATAYPPELCSVAARWRDADPALPVRRILYAEPPLPDEEAELLHAMAPTLELVTPHQTRPALLRGRTIAIAASWSPDMAERGWDAEQLDDLLVELGRYLYAAGATLAYGGDLRRSRGLTWSLAELARSYGVHRGAGPRLRLYLHWPYHESELSREEELSLNGDGVRVVRCARPPELPADVAAADVPASRALTQRCLSAMRRRLLGEVDAHVFVGGKLAGFSGEYAGLLDEAVSAIEAGHPVYPIGALGGSAEALIGLLLGAADGTVFGAAGAPLVARLRGVGVEALRNGLSVGENRELFGTADLERVVELVLLGLSRVSGAERRAT